VSGADRNEHVAVAQLRAIEQVVVEMPAMSGSHESSLKANLKSLFVRATLASLAARLAPYDMLNQRRAAMYRMFGFHGIGRNVLILGPLRLIGRGPIYDLLTIGDDAALASPCTITLYAPVSIGKRVHFGPDVMILTGTHEIGPAEERCGPYRFAPVTIGDGTWLGARVVVLPGVTIGAGCVVSAGAVVTRDVPADMLVAGNPARPVQRLDAGGNVKLFPERAALNIEV